MNASTQLSVRQAAIGFGAGALSMVLVTLVGTALAQTPEVAAPDLQQMLAWCAQMMGQAGSTMQGMMGGMCMIGR